MNTLARIKPRVAAPAVLTAALSLATLAGPAQAASNPYTPQGVCGAGFGVIDHHELRSGAVQLGTVYLLYNAGSGKNCAVTMKEKGVGTKTPTMVFIQRQGAGTKTNRGRFALLRRAQEGQRQEDLRALGRLDQGRHAQRGLLQPLRALRLTHRPRTPPRHERPGPRRASRACGRDPYASPSARSRSHSGALTRSAVCSSAQARSAASGRTRAPACARSAATNASASGHRRHRPVPGVHAGQLG